MLYNSPFLGNNQFQWFSVQKNMTLGFPPCLHYGAMWGLGPPAGVLSLALPLAAEPPCKLLPLTNPHFPHL